MGNSQSVVGVWSLARWGRIRGDGPFLDFGPVARGRLIYLENGLMSAHLERASVDRPAERQVYSYSGRWRTDCKTAFHEVDFANIPEWLGTTLTRTILLDDGERLHLETPPVASRNGDVRDVLEWVRYEARAGQ